MKIMIVGLFAIKYSGEPLAQGFEAQGHKVIRVSTDWIPPNRLAAEGIKCDHQCSEDLVRAMPYPPEDKKFFDKRSQTWKKELLTQQQIGAIYQLEVQSYEYELHWITDKYPDLDQVWILQSPINMNIAGVKPDCIYYYTEINKPQIPYGKHLKGVFYGFYGGDEKLKEAHPYEFNQWEFKILVPYAFDFPKICLRDLKPYKDRKIEIGFKGLRSFNCHSKNPITKYIYLERVRFLDFLHKYYDKEFIEEGNETMPKYIDFMTNTQLAINVPGIEGMINQRQFETWGLGCCLVQFYYLGIEQLGFIGYKFGQIVVGFDENKKPIMGDPDNSKANCFFFETEEQLDHVIQFALERKDICSQIAANGIYAFQNQKHSWRDRARQMLCALGATPAEDVKNITERKQKEMKLKIERQILHNRETQNGKT